MNCHNIKDVLIEEMKDSIDSVIKGEIEAYKSRLLPIHSLIDYIEEKYGVEQDEFETNGWQVDFWIDYTINSIKFELIGSMYYGNIKFQRKEEE